MQLSKFMIAFLIPSQFHTGDSDVILNTYKTIPSNPKLACDVHIWIGDESTQDEYRTAAYEMWWNSTMSWAELLSTQRSAGKGVSNVPQIL
jgi:hypothetical protein